MDRLAGRPSTMTAFRLVWLVSRLNDPNVMQLLLHQAIYEIMKLLIFHFKINKNFVSKKFYFFGQNVNTN